MKYVHAKTLSSSEHVLMETNTLYLKYIRIIMKIMKRHGLVHVSSQRTSIFHNIYFNAIMSALRAKKDLCVCCRYFLFVSR